MQERDTFEQHNRCHDGVKVTVKRIASCDSDTRNSRS